MESAAPKYTIHDGTITLKNRESGRHRTFRIETRRGAQDAFKGKRTLGLLSGPNNTDDFTDFAFVADPPDRPGSRPAIIVWKKHSDSNGNVKARPFFFGDSYANALRRFVGLVPERPLSDFEKHAALIADLLSDSPSFEMRKVYEVSEERECRRCGRKLTTPESIEAGIGPECEQREAEGT